MIYFLDINPEKCAEYYCDSHVVTEIEELCLMMSNCHEAYGSFDEETMPKANNLTEYRWIKVSKSHYRYVAKLAYALGNQFLERYKTRHHLSNLLDEFLVVEPTMQDAEMKFSVPQGYYSIGLLENNDIVEYWRAYYVQEKSMIALWSHTLKPEWYPRESLQDCISKPDSAIKKYAMDRVKHLFK